jgi:hypothetical protein
MVDKYSNQDLENHVASGKTPMKKEYNNSVDLARTKPHHALIEDYYKLNGLNSDELSGHNFLSLPVQNASSTPILQINGILRTSESDSRFKQTNDGKVDVIYIYSIIV